MATFQEWVGPKVKKEYSTESWAVEAEAEARRLAAVVQRANSQRYAIEAQEAKVQFQHGVVEYDAQRWDDFERLAQAQELMQAKMAAKDRATEVEAKRQEMAAERADAAGPDGRFQEFAIKDDDAARVLSKSLAQQGIRPENTLSDRWGADFIQQAHLEAKGQPGKFIMSRPITDGASKVVLVERANDAMAFAQMNQDDGRTLYISSGGPLTEESKEKLLGALRDAMDASQRGRISGRTKPPDLVMACSTSREGAAVQGVAQRERPDGMGFVSGTPPRGHRDWSTALKAHEKTYIQEQGVKMEQKSGQSRTRGIGG